MSKSFRGEGELNCFLEPCSGGASLVFGVKPRASENRQYGIKCGKNNEPNSQLTVIFYIGQMGGGISELESSIAVALNDPSMHMSEKSTLTHASAEQMK
jgi:hypothetical protein